MSTEHAADRRSSANDCSTVFVPTVDDHDSGLVAIHNMPCMVQNGVYREIEPAVIDLNSGIFHPSWRAQRDGWFLIRARSKWQRFVCRFIGVLD
jgi:hypothetical protein